MNPGVFMRNGVVEILFFSVIRLFSAAAGRVTLSLARGAAAGGEHPFAPSFGKVFHQPSDDYRTIGGCPGSGGESTR
jgi:hypothetical protein